MTRTSYIFSSSVPVVFADRAAMPVNPAEICRPAMVCVPAEFVPATASRPASRPARPLIMFRPTLYQHGPKVSLFQAAGTATRSYFKPMLHS